MSKKHFCPICKTNVPMSDYTRHLVDEHYEAITPAIKGEGENK